MSKDPLVKQYFIDPKRPAVWRGQIIERSKGDSFVVQLFHEGTYILRPGMTPSVTMRELADWRLFNKLDDLKRYEAQAEVAREAEALRRHYPKRITPVDQMKTVEQSTDKQ